MGRKILVTGGAGLIGSHLVKSLVEKGFELRVIDNLSNGSRENLGSVIEKIDFIEGDVRDYELVRDSFDGVGKVVHLAAQISVDRSVQDPVFDAETNIWGTINVLGHAVKAGVDEFVFTSSAAVYGEPEGLPLKEDSRARPKSPYGISKRTAERYCELFRELYSSNITVFRIFNVCGAGGEGVIWKFIKQIKRGDTLKVYGSGEQTRDFIHVKDIVGAIEKALEKNTGGLYNLGSGKETSVNKLVEELKKNASKDFSIEHDEGKEEDIERSVAGISKIKKALGWEPAHTLEESVSELMK